MRRQLAGALALLIAVGVSPTAASAADVATVTTLSAEANPLSLIFLPNLTANTTTVDGSPLPSGTLTIVRAPSTTVATQLVGGATTGFSTWADGSYSLGDYEFIATYASDGGALGSSASLVIQYRDLDPPMTVIHGDDWFGQPDVSISFETEEGATSECRLGDEPWTACQSPWTRTLDDGHFRLEVRSTDSEGNTAPHPAGLDFTVDTTPPTGTIRINGGAAATNETVASVTIAGEDNLAAVNRAYYSLSPEVREDGTLDYQPYGSVYVSLNPPAIATLNMDLTYPYWGGTPEDGIKTVYVQFEAGGHGQRSAVISSSIILDTAAPTATAPTRTFVTGSALSSGRITMRLGWTGSDATSGIARYELAQSTDGGAWATVSTSLTKASLDRTLATQRSYRFRVRPIDRAGNVGAWATGATFSVSRYSENNSRIRYSGTWRTASSTAYWGGVAKYATTAGARATFTSTGRSIAWVSRRGPTRGKAEVFVNGTKVATVDLYASNWQNQRIVWSTSWSSAATRTVTIRVVGTSGRPRVDMDAIVTGS